MNLLQYNRNQKEFLGCGIAILLVAIVFLPISEMGFARSDDRWQLLHNPLVNDGPFNLKYLKQLITSFNSNQYSPINTLYYKLIYKINKFDPYYFHLSSFIVHLLNGLLLYILTKKLLSLFEKEDNDGLIYLSLIIWLVHPLNVEAVTWIAASKILLYCFFSLLSLLFFSYALKEDSVMLYLLSLLCYVFSFFSKEQAVVLPVIAAGIVFFFQKNKSGKVGFTLPLKIYFIFCILITLVFCLITLRANGAPIPKMSNYPLHQRFFLSFYCISFYILNLIVPNGLHYHYPFPMKPGESLPIIYYSYFFFFTIIVGAFFKKIKLKSNFFNIFCLFSFIVNLGLCIQIVPLTRTSVVADRYMYLPSFFMLLFLFFYGGDFLKNDRYKKILTYLVIFFVIFLSIYSNHLVENWLKTDLKFYEN